MPALGGRAARTYVPQIRRFGAERERPDAAVERLGVDGLRNAHLKVDGPGGRAHAIGEVGELQGGIVAAFGQAGGSGLVDGNRDLHGRTEGNLARGIGEGQPRCRRD